MGSKCFHSDSITEPAQIIRDKNNREELLSTQREKKHFNSQKLETISRRKTIFKIINSINKRSKYKLTNSK